MPDVGLSHVALPVTNLNSSIEFYAKYARMRVVHRRMDPETGSEVAWVSDGTRPFVIVLVKVSKINCQLLPLAHLGVGCESRQEVNRLCNMAREKGILREAPMESGYPVGYWALISDPDGHTVELAYGQEVGLAVEMAK